MKKYKTLINEALTPQQRMKRSVIARRTAKLRNVTRQRKKMRRKTEQELRVKSQKAARKHMKQRYMRGIKWSQLPYTAREQIEKMVDKRSTAIQKMTLRLMPYIRKGEDARLKKAQKRK